MRYSCQTLFDITATGVTGHYKSASRLSVDEWNHARNQQRNWETLIQIISLRTQVFELTTPVEHNGCWTFEFTVETLGVFGTDDDPTKVLRMDADGVPMLNFSTDQQQSTTLKTQGADQNIWFQQVLINKL